MANAELIKPLRSRLNALPLELKCEIGEVPLQKGMRPTSRKEKVIELLKKYNIDYIEIGTGTNRFIIKYDGYAVKIALDREGIADNKQEFAICESLMPYVAYAHEISKGGHLLVASYCPAFTSHNEMWSHNAEIRRILSNWSKRYLLGDVGLSSYNYANWGLSPEGKPVCIDYAYIFPASLDLFKCICGNKTMTLDGNFSEYKCTKCGHKYQDRELRAKISQQERLRLFSNVPGMHMTEEYQSFEVDPKYIEYVYNPDAPDPYDSAMEVVDHLNGKDTAAWFGSW